jgi:hypothetical protein
MIYTKHFMNEFLYLRAFKIVIKDLFEMSIKFESFLKKRFYPSSIILIFLIIERWDFVMNN